MNKKIQIWSGVLVLCLLSLAGVQAAMAQGVVQTIDDAGVVDWGAQIIRATGIAGINPSLPPGAQRASAIEAAKLAALRNLLQAVNGVTLSSETTVHNAALENDMIQTRVNGAVRHFTIVDTRYLSDQSVEVEIEVPITGVLADAVLPQDFGGGQFLSPVYVCPTCGQPWPAGKPVPPGVHLVRADSGRANFSPGSAYTGLVINAKGLGLVPAMAPKILDGSGREIYGSRFVKREWAVQYGMVGYAKDLSQARKNERAGKNPLVITALRASGPNKADVVVSDADAQRIHQAAQYQNFLEKCRVMFIVD